MNLFFPGNPFRIIFFIFSWRRASEFFFLDFLRPHPQIITGRPLKPSFTPRNISVFSTLQQNHVIYHDVMTNHEMTSTDLER